MALVGLISMQAIYWIFIHPINSTWLHGEALSRSGSAFFGFRWSRRQEEVKPEWMDLRNQWEYAHAARAILATFSFIALVIAIS
jgi:hypothetical protein